VAVVVVTASCAPGRGPATTGSTAPDRDAPGTAVAPDTAEGAAGAAGDPLFDAQWHLRAVGIPDAWAVTRGEGAVVAVLDTGVAYEDAPPYRQVPDLAGTRFVPGWDFVDDDSGPHDVAPPGRPAHGTHMTGTIAQTTGNGLGTAGIAPGATIMPIRVLTSDGRGTSSDIAQGLRFAADHGAHVANLSLGGVEDTAELAEAVTYASDKGVTIVASSGDAGAPTVLFPAAYPDVIAVGAVRLDKTRPGYSSYGEGLDLVAPGGDLSVDQNGDGLDDGVVQQSLNGDASSLCFCFIEGTSSAAAHVSGVAALLVASGRTTTPEEVRDALVSSAEDLGPPGEDDEYGAGLVQAARALTCAASDRAPGSAACPGPARAVRQQWSLSAQAPYSRSSWSTSRYQTSMQSAQR
jgi:serine protease